MEQETFTPAEIRQMVLTSTSEIAYFYVNLLDRMVDAGKVTETERQINMRLFVATYFLSLAPFGEGSDQAPTVDMVGDAIARTEVLGDLVLAITLPYLTGSDKNDLLVAAKAVSIGWDLIGTHGARSLAEYRDAADAAFAPILGVQP